MRLTLLILAALAVVAAVSGQSSPGRGQSNPDRRARFLELRTRARNGDPDAQRILQASRRKRPRPGANLNSEDTEPAKAPAPVPARPTFPRAQRVEENPASVPSRLAPVPSRPTFTRTQRVKQEPAPAPARAKPSRSRTRTPLRATAQRTRVTSRQRQRVARPQAPTTFRPLTPFPNPTTPAPTTVKEIITEEPFKPTVILTEEPVFETFAPTEAPLTTQARFQPDPTQARFQPAPTQAPRVVFQRPVQEPVQEPISRVRTNSRGEERVIVDFEPHRALQNGLEVDQRSETFLGRVRTGATTEAPILTINRYSYFDEEGSYVFGYEAADGSFKEERRALNCIVYGKYGYVDPDGIRREFNYQSGNECDPNAVEDPNLIDGPAPVLNDQFIQQTNERKLSDAELEEVNFNRRRRPQQQRQPVQEPSRVRPASKRPTIERPAPQPEIFNQQFAVEAPVTQAPRISNRFTTPASLNPSHRFSQNIPVDNVVENRRPRVFETEDPRQQQVFKPVPVRPSPKPQFTQAPVRPSPKPQFTQAPVRPSPKPQFTQAPVRPSQKPQFTQAPVRPSPKPQFTQAPVQTFVTQAPAQTFITHPSVQSRPTPKPVSFDFDREFENLFNHFGPVKGVTPRPTPRIPTPVQTTHVTQPQTFKPKPPTFPPTTRQPTTRPPPPPATRPPTLPTQHTNPITTLTKGAHQLVFDPSTGGFKTVRTNVQVQAKPPAAPQHFQPVTTKPFTPFRAAAPTHAPTHAAPTHAPRLASPPKAPAPAGVPLSSTRSFSPLPAVPTSGLIIHNQGSSVSTDEFDKFFSQFNLKF